MLIGQLEFQLDDTILTQRILRLRIGADDVMLCADRIAGEQRARLDVPGFRRGKAPLANLRRAQWPRISALAFEELRKAALDQLLEKLKPEDRPFLPPEVQERDKVRVVYGQALEFSFKYMVDPAGIGSRPEAPQPSSPGAGGMPQIAPPARQGTVRGPQLPAMPATQAAAGAPALPALDLPVAPSVDG